MKLLMISGDRTLLTAADSAFRRTLTTFASHFDRIDIICPRYAGSASTQFMPAVFVHPSPWPLPLQSCWIKRKGRQLIAEQHHDVMTVHEYPPFFHGFGAWLLHRSTKIPYVLEIHHLIGEPQAAGIAERLLKMWSKIFLRLDVKPAAAVRTVASSVDEALTHYGVPTDKIRRAPSFYLDESLAPDPSIAKNYDIVFAGRLVKNKGLPRLLEAISVIPRATLLVVGDGPERGHCERLLRSLKIDDRVTFTGWMQTHRDVMKALQSARVLTMCSLSEGGPRIALEALCCGVPVIATPVGVMPDVIQNGINGFLTRADASDLGHLIVQVLSDRRLQSRMSLAAPKVRETFNADLLIKGYAELLKHLV